MEVTKVEEVLGQFLSKISDYNFIVAEMTDEEIEDELLSYLKGAIAKFHICKKELVITSPVDQPKQFTVVLDGLEIEVLVSLMLVEYMKPQIFASETLKQTLSDKDFKIYSQANQLRELRLLHGVIKADANKLITEYSYTEMRDKR